jgi:hypothetical protein
MALPYGLAVVPAEAGIQLFIESPSATMDG